MRNVKSIRSFLIVIFALFQQAAYAESLNVSDSPFLNFFLQQGGAMALAIILAVIAAAITYWRERIKQRRESKIKAYEAMMISIGAYVRTIDAAKKAVALEKFSEASMPFFVWASKPVLSALSEYMRDSSDPTKQADTVRMRKHFSKLVAAIREDIGIKSTVNDEVSTIAFGYEWNKALCADRSQIPNPLFVEARNIAQQLNSSTLNDKDETELPKRFHELEQEQQLLWVLAEQVDRGQCIGNCIDLYNSRVVAWESSLQSFIHDARPTLRAQ